MPPDRAALPPEAVVTSPRPLPVDTTRPVSISGPLEAATRATLRAELGGSIAAYVKQVGESVRKGDLIAELRVPGLVAQRQSADAQRLAALAQQRVAAREVERLRALEAVGGASRAEIEDAEVRLDAARASLASAEALLAQTAADERRQRIEAPFSGSIARHHSTVGSTVQPGQDIVTVVDHRVLEVRGNLSLAELSAVSKNSRFTLTVPGYAHRVPLIGRVTRIAPQVDSLTNQVLITVQLDNPGLRIPSGAWVDGRLTGNTAASPRN